MRRRVVITGMGIWCPLGSEPEEVARRLTRRETGIGPLTLFEPGVLRTGCAAQVRDFDPRERFSARERRWLDRATLLALVVAERALQSAGWPDGAPARERMGLCVGASGAGQFQRVQYTLDGRPLEGRYAAMSHARSVLHLQGQTLAHRFGLRGPQASFCTASAGSALAVLHAFQLLQAGKTDFMLAGGAELLSVASLMAVDALGLTATGPCSAFSGPSGMTFGEGAAFVVLEPYDRAAARGARMFGELLGGAATCDAFDPLAGDPSGQGAYRALKAALQGAGVEPRQVGWIKASGTGLAAQDRAESSALERLFDSKCPPVCSLEPALGHPNGATPVVGLVAALASRGAGFIPPTLNEGAPRPGCGLDYVADGPRPTTGEYLVANTIAFGGLNTALVVGDVRERPAAPAPPTDVSLTGVGLVSPVGVGLEAFAAALRAGHSGVQEVTRFEPGRGRVRRAALVPLDAQPRGGRRPVDRVKHYAARAVGAALESAGLVPGERVGLVVACSRPPVGAQERFFTALPGNERGVAGAGRAVLEMGSFSVLSELSARFKLQGLGAVLTEGVSSGLHALAHGVELLRSNDALDALIVVAADELSPLFLRLYASLGVLAPGADAVMCPYSLEATGMVLGEGSVAVVLERAPRARARGARALANVAGSALTSDARGFLRMESHGLWLEHAVRSALAEAGVGVDGIDLVYGHGRGQVRHDARETRALRRVLQGRPTPVGCVLGNTGVAEATSGLFSVAAAVLALQRGEAYPIVSGSALPDGLAFVQGEVRSGLYRRVLVAGSTESGANAAVVLTRADTT